MKQVLFLSDFHFGIPNYEISLIREKKICDLLDKFKDSVSEIYFVGDIFDFWFEYKTVVPKGFYRFFGKLAELSDKGVQLHFFKGNHDMWMRDFFKIEFKAKIYSEPISIMINNRKFYIGHGDGLGPGDYKYKMLKHFFSSSFCKFLYRWIHPDIGMSIANFFSKRSRFSQENILETYHGDNHEWLFIYAKEILKSEQFDYFVFGHRHLPIFRQIENSGSKYINLGDWLSYDTYAVFDGNELSLYKYDSDKKNLDFSPEPN